jgi:hypothetical protein
MSVLRPLLSRRGRLVFVAAALFLIGTLVAAPSVSGAPPARVKQFTASLSGGAPGSFTMTVTNCGGTPLVGLCTRSSTIDLGAVQIVIPLDFQPATFVSALTPSGTTWTGSYNTVTKTIDVVAPGGSNKLRPGQSLLITFTVTSTTCEGTNEFTTLAWGANAIAGSDSFELLGSQPTVACVGSSGGTVEGPNGQTETITGNFTGHVIVTFGGDLDCSFDPTFGAQWSQFHLPTQVNITPGTDFAVGNPPTPKTTTSKFPAAAADSSSYLICYAVPRADHLTPFKTRGGGDAAPRTVNGVDSWVGILPNCYKPTPEPPSINQPPCVSEQFLELTTNKIVISVRVPPEDPYKR